MKTVQQVVDDEIARLVDATIGEGIPMTDNEIACFRAGMTRGLEAAQAAHDKILDELGITDEDLR